MHPRGLVLAGLALVFLASRLLGLHLHAGDHDHQPEHESAIHLEIAADDHHLDDHLLNGERDVESIAIPTDHKRPVTVPALSCCYGVFALLLPLSGPVRANRPPLPPPRPSRWAFILPPSQGPPVPA